MNWWKNIFKVGLLMGLSKVIGFARDLLIAAFFGTSKLADAFNFAYLFTGNIFILLGGVNGPFHSAFIASLPTESENNKEKQNQVFTQSILISLLAFLILSIFFTWCSAWYLPLILGQQKSLILETTKQIQLMFPVFILSGAIGILFGASASKQDYFWPSISPLINSFCLIFILLVFYKQLSVLSLGLGYSLGAVAQFFIQFYHCQKVGFKLVKIKLNENWLEIKKFIFILLPALLSSSIGSLNVYIDSFFCANLPEGSWTAILMANRLIQLPFGILVGSALLSFLPRATSLKNNINDFTQNLSQEIINLFRLLIPASILTLVLAKPLIQILFQRGSFDYNSTNLVNLALIGLSFSLISALPREIYTRAFYALGDSKWPFYISLLSLIWNALFDYLLVQKFQVLGIALSTTLTAFINSLLLAICLYKQFKINIFSGSFILKILWLCLIGSLTYLVCNFVFDYLENVSLLNNLPKINWLNLKSLAEIIICGITTLIVYFGLLFAGQKIRKFN